MAGADQDEVARFTRAYDEHYDHVYAYAASRVGRQLAEEVASETFLVAWRRIAELPDPAVAYLIGIARNVIRSQYRRAASDETLRAELRPWAGAPVTPDIADGVTERSAVLHALARLSAADREVLTLVGWYGLSSAQAAEVLGCSPASYWVRLHRARRRLERALDREPAGHPVTDRAAADHPASAAVPDR